MLDIKYIRENPEEVIARLLIKGKDARADLEIRKKDVTYYLTSCDLVKNTLVFVHET